MYNPNHVALAPALTDRFPEMKERPIAGYKFLHSTDLHFWLEELTVKIDNLYSYSKMESKGGVSDPLEIKIKEFTVTVDHSEAPQSELAVRNLATFGFKLEHLSGFTFKCPDVIRKNRSLYCISRSLNKEIFQKWRETEGYDTVIKINDLVEFATSIQIADYHGNKRFPSMAILDCVEYADMPLDLHKVDITTYKFFKEKSSFEWQDELRLTWDDTPDNDSPPLIMHIPDLADLFEVVTIPQDWLT